MENKENNSNCFEIGICGRCVYLLRFDELNGRTNVCIWQKKNRSVAGKIVKCDGFKLGSIYDNSKCIENDKYMLEDGTIVRPSGSECSMVDNDDDDKINVLNDAERKFFGWVGDKDDKTFANILNGNVLNRMRAERDRLDRVIKEAERREMDLTAVKNERIVWERRLECVEVGSGVKIGDVEIRTKEEIEAVVRMFQEIEARREG